MESFNSENLLATLFASGFNQVDSILYNLVLNKILEEQKGNSAFKFIESSTDEFRKLVSYDGFIYQLNDGLTFEINNFTNKKLIEYIKTIDFRIIILQKISLIGVDRLDRINKLSSLFSNKEKEIINVLFGVEEMQQELHKKSMEVYSKLYDQESKDIDNVIKSLSKFNKNN